MERILLVGHGFAGHRYARALRYLEKAEPGSLRVCGVVDREPGRLASVFAGWPTFASLEAALDACDPTAVVLAVNEHAHFAVLEALPPGVRTVLSEKPLTATLDESLRLMETLAPRYVSVNMVERHSPVLAQFFAWRAEHPGMTPVRVEFFWGKDRVGDRRPTMGVLSELTHPLDLVDYLLGCERWRVRAAHGVSSDFAPSSPGTLDSLDLLLDCGAFTVIGHTSFVWPRRHRNLTVFLSDDSGDLHKAILDFDVGRWDCDRLEIHRVHARKADRRVFTAACRNDDFPRELHQIYKVTEFVRKSLAGAAARARFPELVDYAQAVKVQRLLEELDGKRRERGGAYGDARLSGVFTPAGGAQRTMAAR